MITDAEAVGEQGIMIPNSRSSGRADSTVERIYYSIEVSRNQRGPK
jgi:tetrahydromethanopterin S-methyltransferase subunit F